MPVPRQDHTGQRFESLLVLGPAPDLNCPGGARVPRWRTRCDCGAERVVLGTNLRAGRVIACSVCTRRTPLAERLWAHVNKSGPVPEYRPELGPCWVWTRRLTKGYGVVRVGGKGSPRRGVHRIAYEMLVGPIPEALFLDHLCRNRACCNPKHLEPVTNAVNLSRGMGPGWIAHRANQCQRGHSLAGIPRRKRRAPRCPNCTTERRLARARMGVQ